MRTIFVILTGILLFIADGALAMGDLHVSGSLRYKMTVAVETPEGIKTGSAVREISNEASKIDLHLPQVGNPAKVVGEAVTVDLGKRGVLFALLNGYKGGPDYAEHIVYWTFGGGSSVDGVQALSELAKTPGKKTILKPEHYPVLVTFENMKDPKTVARVLEMRQNEKSPFELIVQADHFEKLFGKGVNLKEISIEVTDEPVTHGVVRYLPWLHEYYGRKFDGLRFNTIKSEYPFANTLSAGAFIIEENINE